MDITQIDHHGFRFNIRVRNGFQDYKVLNEVISSDSYALEELSRCVQPETILDIGGHIGSFGVFAKSFWPNARLVAVEPCEESARLYEMNLKSNKMDGRVINAAVGYKNGCLLHASRTTGGHLVVSPERARMYIATGHRTWSYTQIEKDEVPVITIEELTKDIPIVDLVKWDCEGGEVDSFENMSDESARKFRLMLGEYHCDARKYLTGDIFDWTYFWRNTRRKFPHLFFNYKYNNRVLFQAWPRMDYEKTSFSVSN